MAVTRLLAARSSVNDICAPVASSTGWGQLRYPMSFQSCRNKRFNPGQALYCWGAEIFVSFLCGRVGKGSRFPVGLWRIGREVAVGAVGRAATGCWSTFGLLAF